MTLNSFGTVGSRTSADTLTGGSMTYNVNPGATLLLDDSTNNNIHLVGRINPAANLNLTGATFQLNGNNLGLVNTTQSVGTITLAGGGNTITTQGGHRRAAPRCYLSGTGNPWRPPGPRSTSATLNSQFGSS